MTRDEIMNAPAGVSLDWHIAHFVMGLPSKELTVDDCPCAYCGNQMRYCGARSWCSECHEWRHVAYKDYSDDLVSAWEVVEKMDVETELYTHCKFGGFPNMPFGCKFSVGKYVYLCLAETMPLAICRAALFAKINPE